MNIHVVQPGDTINSIAEKYGVPASQIMQDNELANNSNLVTGQTIVILYPEQIHLVKEGDSLLSIASDYEVPVMQLIRNNIYLLSRDFIYPGETIVIRYSNNKGVVTTNGYANAFVDKDVLKKTLPYLTYLSVFGYRSTKEADIIEVDDSEIIKIAKEFGVAPIMLLSTLTYQGTASAETAYSIIGSDEMTDMHIQNILHILKTKGFCGVNITFQFITSKSMPSYENYYNKVTSELHKEGFLVFLTFTPTLKLDTNQLEIERIDYSKFYKKVDGITIMNYNWGYNYGPPAPVSSIKSLNDIVEYATTIIPPEKLDIGMPIIGYDWELPYILGITKATSMTLDRTLELARLMEATIQFDDISQTPNYEYEIKRFEASIDHKVWFVDARTIDALASLAIQYKLDGTGIWNIANYYAQMWLVINSQYEIKKVLLTVLEKC